MASSGFTIGDRVGGRYRLERLLGEGGMAKVWLAHDETLAGRTVAVKAPHPELLREAAVRERFLREARRLIELQHPHIVPLHDAGFHGPVPFLVMGYMAGGSLRDLAVRRAAETADGSRQPPVDELTAWLPSVAAALDFAHGRGIVHRDVKPENVLFDAAGMPRVADFGLAKALVGESTLTPTGDLVGTATYVPPEAVVVDPATGAPYATDGLFDQYALGTTVFELLAGFPPFPGGSPAGVLYLKSKQDAPSLGRARPDAPAALVAAVDRALARDRRARWPSCRAFATAAAG